MARSKPKTKIRRAPDLKAVDSFINGGDVQTSKRSNVQSPKRPNPKGVIKRNSGRRLDRLTVYLEEDLGRRLRVHAASNRQELSGVVTEALAAYLTR